MYIVERLSCTVGRILSAGSEGRISGTTGRYCDSRTNYKKRWSSGYASQVFSHRLCIGRAIATVYRSKDPMIHTVPHRESNLILRLVSNLLVACQKVVLHLRFELRMLDSKSRVITTSLTESNLLFHTHKINNCPM
jgi:hypothetical protein